MTITNKTRKILWARSGNRCAICRRELVAESSEIDGDSVVGEECHIVARELKGPRGDSPLTLEERDSVNNLILLCRNHHKLVDDQPNRFTVEFLHNIKSKHVEWVRESLSSQKQNTPELFFAYRIDTGTQLWNTVIECDGYSFDMVQPETEEEAYLLGDFAQNMQDYGDLWNVIESRDRVMAQFELDKQIKQLNESGLLIYTASRKQRLVSTTTKNSTEFFVGYVLVLRKENSIVQRKDEEIESLMKAKGQTRREFSNYVPVMLNASSFRFL